MLLSQKFGGGDGSLVWGGGGGGVDWGLCGSLTFKGISPFVQLEWKASA